MRQEANNSNEAKAMRVGASEYYSEYHGHPVEDLNKIVQALREQGKTIIWTAGDSSLDNKFWFDESHAAVNGYQLMDG